MQSHLTIEGPDGNLAINPDTQLPITDKNPMFNDVEMFSHPIQLPFDLNRHLLKNMDDVNSSIRAADVEGGRYRIIVDGIPFRTATIRVQDAVKLDGSIDVNFDAANRTFKDMIADMRCRDVKVDDDILIGEKISDVQVYVQYREIIEPVIENMRGEQIKGYRILMKKKYVEGYFEPFSLGFSFPGKCYEVDDENDTHKAEPDPETPTRTYPNPNGGGDIVVNNPHVQTSYINTSLPYPEAKYCNSRIAYAHHRVKVEEGKPAETSDEIVPADERNSSIAADKSPYWVLDANRPASGICFYVAYFLERLFKQLGVAYDMSALTDIEDFNYLAFFTTECHYDVKLGTIGSLYSEEEINNWLSSRGCGGKVNLKTNVPDEVYLSQKGIRTLTIAADEYESWSVIGDHGANNQLVSNDITSPDGSININYDWHTSPSSEQMVPNSLRPEYYYDAVRRYEVLIVSMAAEPAKMYANSDNFPDADVSEVIESLENSFGVRFCYDAESNKVTVRLLRDMFRDTQPPIPFKGIVTKMVKQTETIKGVRMKYSAESDARERQENVKYGRRDYNTIYDYEDYPEGHTKFASFEEATSNIDVANRNGYCDLRNGNFYRIKVASDATSTDELRPSIFEVGAMHGVELGDCSKEPERDNRIREFVSDFSPIEVNDVAYRGKNFAYQEAPLLVPFTDDDMEHEFLVKKLLNPISAKWGNIDLIYELCLAECYDPTKTDDGQSPLQHHDWGLAIGFLRPATNTAGAQNVNYGYDGFGNSQWIVTPQNYTFNSDTFDEHANFLGRDPQTSFSLKPRAYKPFRYKYVNNHLLISTDPKQWESETGWLIPCDDDTRDANNAITQRLRSRGTCDTFMIDFFKFLLDSQPYYVEAICTAAELADIPNKWLRRFIIDGKVGWINTVTYPVSAQSGIGKVEIEFYAL